MPDSFKVYNSMAEFYAAMGGTIEQSVEFTIHRLEEIHGDVPIKSPLFRANYYSIVLIRQGRGLYLVDNERYETKAGMVYFNNPGHVKGFEIYELSKGFVITFAESFLKQYVHEAIFDEFPFLIAEVSPPEYLNSEAFQGFDDLGNQLLQEYNGHSPYKYKIVGNLMVVLLLKFKEMFWKTYDPLHEVDRGSQIVIDFKRSLEGHFRDLLAGKCDRPYQVQDYAQAQYLHPSYFSTVIKRKTGKSVNSWIAEKTVAEAQALLARSPATVQEIAFQLGFKDAAHFSRFFKKHTELSPLNFRQSLQG